MNLPKKTDTKRLMKRYLVAYGGMAVTLFVVFFIMTMITNKNRPGYGGSSHVSTLHTVIDVALIMLLLLALIALTLYGAARYQVSRTKQINALVIPGSVFTMKAEIYRIQFGGHQGLLSFFPDRVVFTPTSHRYRSSSNRIPINMPVKTITSFKCGYGKGQGINPYISLKTDEKTYTFVECYAEQSDIMNAAAQIGLPIK